MQWSDLITALYILGHDLTITSESDQLARLIFSILLICPLGELVQWSDLITALYILGHDLTITSESDQLAR